MRLKIGEAVNGHVQRRKTEGRSGITSHVAATGKPYITGNVDADPYYFAFFDDVCSEIAVPLVDGNDRVRGVINIESFRPDYFTEDHLRLLQSLADIAAMRLMMDGYRARETALVEIGKDLSAIADTVLLMRRVVDVAAEVLRFEDCSLFVLDRDKNELVLQASRGGLADRVGQATYPLGEGLTGWVGQHGEAIRTASPKTTPAGRAALKNSRRRTSARSSPSRSSGGTASSASCASCAARASPPGSAASSPTTTRASC